MTLAPRAGRGTWAVAARRASGVLLTAPDVSATKDEMIRKEIQEMRDTLQAFQTPIEAGEVAGIQERLYALARRDLIRAARTRIRICQIDSRFGCTVGYESPSNRHHR